MQSNILKKCFSDLNKCFKILRQIMAFSGSWGNIFIDIITIINTGLIYRVFVHLLTILKKIINHISGGFCQPFYDFETKTEKSCIAFHYVKLVNQRMELWDTETGQENYQANWHMLGNHFVTALVTFLRRKYRPPLPIVQ